MSNQYTPIYNKQVGDGLPVFIGLRNQRGHNFFGRLLSGVGSFFKSLVPDLLKTTLTTGVNIADDYASGKSLKESAKERLLEAGKSAASQTLDKIKSRIQGGGRKRKKKQVNKRKKRRRKW
jgi:hypothetical protein